MTDLNEYQIEYVKQALNGKFYEADKQHTKMFASYDAPIRNGNHLIFPQQFTIANADIEIQIHLKNHGWDIHNYHDGLASRIKNGVLELRRIGKVLQQTGGDKIYHSKKRDSLVKGVDGKPIKNSNGELVKKISDQTLLGFYNTDPERVASKQEYNIVISRDIKDIAAMSTNKNWSSCMTLPDDDFSIGGFNHTYLKSDFAKSTLIAFAIKNGDSKPTGRLLIKRYVYTNIFMIPHYIYRPDYKSYGSVPSSFFYQIESLMKKHYPAKKGATYILDKGLYNDDRDTITHITDGFKYDFKFNVEHYKNGELNDYMSNGVLKPAIHNLINGTFCHYKDGFKHRDSDEPTAFDGETYKHYINGHLHRDGDMPAIYHIKNRYETYYKFGLLHRDNGKPAVIHINSVDEYYKFGIRDFSKSYQ